MHEFSICQSLLTQVETIAAQHQAQTVAVIVVQLGPLCGVVPDLLAQAFNVASIGTVAEKAELMLELRPLRIHCPQCNTDSEVEPNALLCKTCGNWRTQLLSGDEMILARVELEKI